MEKQRTFANGIFFNEPHEKVKDFMIGSVVLSKANFLTWLDQQEADQRGYIKLDIKRPQDPTKKIYFELNTYVPQQSNSQPAQAQEESVPF